MNRPLYSFHISAYWCLHQRFCSSSVMKAPVFKDGQVSHTKKKAFLILAPCICYNNHRILVLLNWNFIFPTVRYLPHMCISAPCKFYLLKCPVGCTFLFYFSVPWSWTLAQRFQYKKMPKKEKKERKKKKKMRTSLCVWCWFLFHFSKLICPLFIHDLVHGTCLNFSLG